MLTMLKSWSVVPKSLKYKLLIAFSLMSIIPLLVLVYLLYDSVLPYAEDITWISTIVLISIIIAILGLAIAKGLIDPIIQLASEATIIAHGKFNKDINLERDDEIGDLGDALNQITHHIRENMDELKSYGERTKEINLEINKKVVALAGLLQIGSLISTSVELGSVLKLIIEKVAQIDDAKRVLLLLRTPDKDSLAVASAFNIEVDKLKNLEIKEGKGALGRILLEGNDLIIDQSHPAIDDDKALLETLELASLAAIPIALHGRVEGILISGGDNEASLYEVADIDTLRVFGKQVAISIENDFLNKQARELQTRDDLTGLYNQHYIRERLDEEIKRSITCQRPCSFVIFNIDNFTKYRDENGELSAEGALRSIAQIIKANISDIDRVARYGDDEFALVLPEKNKKEAIRIASRITNEVYAMSKDKDFKLTVSGGLSENPLDGNSAAELIDRANQLLVKAKKDGKNRVEV